MTEINRRTMVVGAAWAMPVIAAAVAVPLAAASVAPGKLLLTCTPLDVKGQPLYQLAYDDQSTEIVDQGQVNRDKELQVACRDKGPLS